MSSSSTSASSASIGDISFYSYPLITPKADNKEKKKDWVKIGAIVTAVIGGLIAALAIVCIMGIFPHDLLGGPLGTGITLIAGAALLLPSAYVLYDRWKNPPQS